VSPLIQSTSSNGHLSISSRTCDHGEALTCTREDTVTFTADKVSEVWRSLNSIHGTRIAMVGDTHNLSVQRKLTQYPSQVDCALLLLYRRNDSSHVQGLACKYVLETCEHLKRKMKYFLVVNMPLTNLASDEKATSLSLQEGSIRVAVVIRARAKARRNSTSLKLR
jgi:hypothetical protein